MDDGAYAKAAKFFEKSLRLYPLPGMSRLPLFLLTYAFLLTFEFVIFFPLINLLDIKSFFISWT